MHYYWPREPQGRELENLTQLFKVLGDPFRTKVLFQIGSSEACVTEVAARLNMSESAVSSPYPNFTHERFGSLAQEWKGYLLCSKR